MYRVGKRAYAHGNYIRPDYASVWKEARRQAAANHVSLSEFISHALYVFMTGRIPEHGKLRGHVYGLEDIAAIGRRSAIEANRRRTRKSARPVPRTERSHEEQHREDSTHESTEESETSQPRATQTHL